MPSGPNGRLLGTTVATLAAVAALLTAPPALAAGPPSISASWASAVFATSARLSLTVDPNGFATGYHFDYITETVYQANLAAAKDGFAGASRMPPQVNANVGSGAPVTAFQSLAGLQPDTAYRYRAVATNTAGTSSGPAQRFFTQSTGGGSLLPDGRGWEMVSPVDKNGGEVGWPGLLAGGGVMRAAAGGGAVTYGATASFAGGSGAAPASQYVAVRSAGGWSTQNVTAPLYAGSYGVENEGTPYRLFSPDLSRALLFGGRHCRGEVGECPVANPPLPGTDAPSGYQNYYLRDNGGGGFEALLSGADLAATDLDPADFEVVLAAASEDLRHVVLSTCAALTADAEEVSLGEECDPAAPNLYRSSAGGGLSLINLLPAASQGAPGAQIAAPAGAVSGDGQRIYWRDLGSGNLYLRDGGQTVQVDAAAGGGGRFELATANGSVALYAKGGHLWRYQVAGSQSTDLTPGGGVLGILGASADASRVYYVTASGLFLRDGASTDQVAGIADPGNYPPATGTARVSADGGQLVFVATAPLTGYDNTDLQTGLPDAQVFHYDLAADRLACVSCNPTSGRPIGPSGIPGARSNGTGPAATVMHKPRVLSADGSRVYFESADALGLTDTNAATDVYQWQAPGSGGCVRAGGCVALISSGRSAGGDAFLDASADGADVFFLTARSLVSADPGGVDVYDARVGGGFPEPISPISCTGDSCQVLPPEPVDPTLTTLLSGPGNPAVRYAHRAGKPSGKRCAKGKAKRKKCGKAKAGGGKKGKKRRGNGDRGGKR